MHGALDYSTYTGSYSHGLGHQHTHDGMHGFCHSCCHPISKCGCGCRQCRKEPKELLVTPATIRDPGSSGMVGLHQAGFFREAASVGGAGTAAEQKGAAAEDPKFAELMSEMTTRAAFVGGRAAPLREFAKAEAALAIGAGSAFIGGGCCVHLSIEYTPTTPTVASLALVFVDDSEGTILAWAKLEQPGIGYKIRECIITTKPGADLKVLVLNMTARVRWCEIFSC